MPQVYITRRSTFSCAHRLHSVHLSEAENRKVFGKCNNPKGHGHNYVLEVTLKMPIDPLTGMAMNLVDLKRIVEEQFVDGVDHKHLDEDVAWFKGVPTTAENIVVVAWNRLVPHLPTGSLHEIKLRETENNVASYRGES